MPENGCTGWKDRNRSRRFAFGAVMMKHHLKILILMGPMGCGKTTIGLLLSQKLGWPFIDADDLHPEENVAKMRAGIALTDEDRLPWLNILRDRIGQWIEQNQSAVLGCSALKQTYRDRLGIDQETVISVYLKGSYQVLQERVAARHHPYMDKNLLQSQLDTLEEPDGGIVVDIAQTPEETTAAIMDALAPGPFEKIPGDF